MTVTPPPPHSPLAVLSIHPMPPAPPKLSPAGGLAIASLVVGIVALALGLVPFAGIALGVTGVIIGIIAVIKPARVGLTVTGIALSTIAIIVNLAVLAAMLFASPGGAELGKRTMKYLSSLPTVSGQRVTTPCYSFEGPRNFINNQSKTATADCSTALQLWGEMDADGKVRNTGGGIILGEVSVEPIPESTRQKLSAEADLDGVVETMSTGWLTTLGEITSLKEPTSLDGEPGNVTRVKSPVALTKTKAVVAGFAPDAHNTSRGEVRLFVVTFVTPYDNGDELIKAVVASWKWN